mmetsp:Transcript_3155/g.4991  ORF Transcript_3155/g.4991 Transcript_3155/m.4991 type:complete len:112 (+) Transcript_3155:75-410(+)
MLFSGKTPQLQYKAGQEDKGHLSRKFLIHMMKESVNHGNSNVEETATTSTPRPQKWMAMPLSTAGRSCEQNKLYNTIHCIVFTQPSNVLAILSAFSASESDLRIAPSRFLS